MQKLSDEIWYKVYKDYMAGESLSDIFWLNEGFIDAHHTVAAFRKAFDNYLGRAKLPDRD
jgi:hypothetical protein